LDDRSPEAIAKFMPLWEWFYRYYFRVTTDGWQHVPAAGSCLVVGSHNGGLAAPDMFALMYDWYRRYGYDRPAYGLMHPRVWDISPVMSRWAVECGAVMAAPKMAMAAFRRQAMVLVYPGGIEDVFRPYSQRHRIEFANRKGFIKLALRAGVPILPTVSTGAHESIIVLNDIYPLMKQLHEWGMPWLANLDPMAFPIYLGLPWGLAFGPLPNFPLPTQIHNRICAPIYFDRYGRDAANDSDYVDRCYNLVLQTMQSELDLLVKERSMKVGKSPR
jgi:1-acyl-sn-glycerol-3-phosphate acyltransferase